LESDQNHSVEKHRHQMVSFIHNTYNKVSNLYNKISEAVCNASYGTPMSAMDLYELSLENQSWGSRRNPCMGGRDLHYHIGFMHERFTWAKYIRNAIKYAASKGRASVRLQTMDYLSKNAFQAIEDDDLTIVIWECEQNNSGDLYYDMFITCDPEPELEKLNDYGGYSEKLSLIYSRLSEGSKGRKSNKTLNTIQP